MSKIKSFSFQNSDSPLNGEKIKQVSWGNPTRDDAKPYSAITLTMASGKVFVITQCLGEVQIDECV